MTIDTHTVAQAAPTAEQACPDAGVDALRGQAEVDRRRQRQLGALGAVAVVGFGLIYYWPSASRLTSLRAQITQGARQLTVDRQRAALLPQVQVQADRLERELAPMKPLAGDQGLGVFMRDLNAAAGTNGIGRLTWTPAEPVAAGELGTRTMRVQFTGRYVDVFAFLRYVEQSPRAVTVGELTLRPAASSAAGVEAPQRLDVDLSLRIHFLAGS